ncbi:antiviral reverse transcriptase Drt2 [Pseudomonas protegens]|uniref:antiviral reverse transcriptase Drt2 n=1 Tax=Pseudomonas protegens TaxID=380021 RepID=UPI0021AD31B0|nr:antiviral reverse transcriptase Drt2 [Pseudomonas protegens]
MDELPWYKSRKYLHFDRPIGQKTALDYVSSPQKVSAHSFYPFITYTSLILKYRLDNDRGVFVKNPKPRPISYSAHLDSHIYSYYNFILSQLYERELVRHGLHTSVLAFRSIDGKSNIHFAHDAFSEIKAKGECCVLAFDVEKFFDRLDHLRLKAAWARLLGVGKLPTDHYAVFKAITKSTRVDKTALYNKLGVSIHNPRVEGKRLCSAKRFRDDVRDGGLLATNPESRGIPQGSPISALLSNIYMLEFDLALLSKLSLTESIFYRYCDDILVICGSEKENEIYEFVSNELRRLELNLQEKKTEVRQFVFDAAGKLRSDKPVHYLGFSFDGQREHIRSSSITRYYKKLRKRIWVSKKAMDRCNELRAGRGELPRELFLRTIYRGYSYLGRRNFISYGFKAAHVMNSQSIRKQLRPHWKKLKKMLADAGSSSQ